jgi:hypothetical protein
MFLLRLGGIVLSYNIIGYFVEEMPSITEVPAWICISYFTLALIPALYFSSNSYLTKIRPDLMETRQVDRLFTHADNPLYKLTYFTGEYLMALVNSYYLIFFVMVFALVKNIF